MCCGQNAYLLEGGVPEITAEKAAEYLALAELPTYEERRTTARFLTRSWHRDR